MFDRSGKIRVKTEELYVFASHMATLLEAGVPLLTCLSILAEQTDKQAFKTIIKDMIDDIKQGANLTTALSKYPKVFSKLFIALVHAGERSGNMVQVLQQLSHHLRAQDQLQKKLNSALVYPKFVLSFFVLILLTIVFALIPKFEGIFESFDAELPAATRMLLSISDFAKDNLLIEAAILIVATVLFQKYKNEQSVVNLLDRLRLKIPFVGDIVWKSLLSKFCRTLSLLLNSGLSLVDSLEIAGRTADNVHFKHALKRIKTGVIEGKSLHGLLRRFPIFPILMVQMVNVGESSGSLDKMLDKLSEIYESGVDSKIDGLSSIIEPAIMVCLGAVALVVIIALYLPIFNLGATVR